MMNDKKIIEHPCVILNDSLKQICEPLKLLGIDYFSQVRIYNKNNGGGFSSITSNIDYHIHYLDNHYYNCDIHMAANNDLGDMIVWDFIKRGGDSDKMVREAQEFGISHLFTLVKKNQEFCDYFHFASSHSDETINQVYISHQDYLEKFILYFSDKVKRTKEFSSAWDIQFELNENKAIFEIPAFNEKEIIEKIHDLSCNTIYVSHKNHYFVMTAKEYSILHWLSFGKTAEEIAIISGISASGVRKHIENIKAKSHCYSLFQLGELYANIRVS